MHCSCHLSALCLPRHFGNNTAQSVEQIPKSPQCLYMRIMGALCLIMKRPLPRVAGLRLKRKLGLL